MLIKKLCDASKVIGNEKPRITMKEQSWEVVAKIPI